MNSTTIYGVFADKEQLFIFLTEMAINYGVIERFNVFVVFILQKSLVNYLLWDLFLVY